ncbi:hypothetical protein C8034_v011988 [Colletotrichum sidae]|uniref:Uncharacterized protein n=1 Tax=Colletotrichum sidae TaxID=1347389 RepID=A0A4R8TJX8_9PEZI|nr:hypothetical protein C8034_v011988 [Colletotrichum sidae]
MAMAFQALYNFILLSLVFTCSLRAFAVVLPRHEGGVPPPLPEAKSLEARARKAVPSAASLGCSISAHDGAWKKLEHYYGGRVDFEMVAKADDDDETLFVQQVQQSNQNARSIKAREALVAFWKDESRFAPKYLRHIKYLEVVHDPTLSAIEEVLLEWEPDCSDKWCRVPWSSKDAFQYLIDHSPFAKGANYIPDEYEDFARLYVSSFDFADPAEHTANEMWFRVNFKSYDDE